MLNMKTSIRAALALALFAAAPSVFAQSAYNNGTPVQIGTQTTIPLALGPNGEVAVGTPVEQFSDGSFSNASVIGQPVSLPFVNNFVSGANGANIASFGPTESRNAQFGFIQIQNNGYAYGAGNSSSFNVVAIGANGIASNLNNLNGDEDEGGSGVGFSGVVTSPSGAVRYVGNGTLLSGINSSNAVSGTLYANAGGYSSNPAFTGSTADKAYNQFNPSNVGPAVPAGQGSVPFYEAANAPAEVLAYSGVLGHDVTLATPKALATLGFGGVGTGINTIGQVVGNDYLSANTQQCFSFGCFGPAPNTEAFITAANGGTVKFLGLDGGVGTTATSVNNAGEVGGYVTLASGQTEGFITTTAGLFTAATPGASTDNTAVEFLNAAGQAIIDDKTTNTWYLDNNGNMVSIASLFAPGALDGVTIDAVVGFNNLGQILLQVSDTATGDPGLFISPNAGVALPTGQSVQSTAAFTQMADAQGGQTPDASFFTTITGDADLPGTPDGAGGGSSVPAPLSSGLMGLGFALVGFARRRKAPVSGAVGI